MKTGVRTERKIFVGDQSWSFWWVDKSQCPHAVLEYTTIAVRWTPTGDHLTNKSERKPKSYWLAWAWWRCANLLKLNFMCLFFVSSLSKLKTKSIMYNMHLSGLSVEVHAWLMDFAPCTGARWPQDEGGCGLQRGRPTHFIRETIATHQQVMVMVLVCKCSWVCYQWFHTTTSTSRAHACIVFCRCTRRANLRGFEFLLKDVYHQVTEHNVLSILSLSLDDY